MPNALLTTSTKDLKDAFTFNVGTAHALTTAAVPLMLEQSGGGSIIIINITSTMGRVAGRGFAAYGTAKAALAHYTRLAALDLCSRIRVNAIAPGSIVTSALEIVASNDELREPMEKVTPLRRLGDPLDIAAAAVYLASPAGSFLTGKTLEVDGGLTFPNLELPIPDLYGDRPSGHSRSAHRYRQRRETSTQTCSSAASTRDSAAPRRDTDAAAARCVELGVGFGDPPTSPRGRLLPHRDHR